LERLQRVRDVGHAREEVDRLVELHLQHVADALAAPPSEAAENVGSTLRRRSFAN